MANRLALLLPLLAALVVGIGLGAAVMLQGGGGRPAPVSAGDTPTATENAPTVAARVRPSGSVCQGLARQPAPGEPRAFAPEYTQQRRVLGLTVVADGRVDSRAFDEAAKTIERLFQGNDLQQALTAAQAYVVIADKDQGVLDLPEFACLEGQLGSDFFSNVCGVADRADYPVATVNELDLLGDRKGPCGGLNILYHELGHLVQGWAISPADYFDIKLAYQAALDAGKYRNAYAATNSNEYFAEATQAYFLHVEGSHDRAWLRRYDPAIYEILARVYGD